MIGRCDNCAFWFETDLEDRCVGTCHRYAPSPLSRTIGEGKIQGVWPRVHKTSFCGDFTEKTKAKK